MIIEAIRTYHISKKLSRPLVNSVYSCTDIEHILVEVDAEGYTGIGYVYSFNKDQAKAIKTLIDGFVPNLIGKEADLIRSHWNYAKIIYGGIGHTGLQIIAWTAYDVAFWDLLSKRAGLPLYKMLGAARNEVPVYASGGFLVPVEQVVEEAVAFKEQGYRHYKMKVGHADYREDIRRIERVQAAVGNGMEILVDANQGWSVERAKRMAPLLLGLGITYLEEPLNAQDYQGYAELRKTTMIDIVAGESLFTLTENFELMHRGGVSILNPDLQRCGGITEFMQVCSLANAYRIAVSSHIFTEVSVHLMAAVPTMLYAEYIPDWWAGIFEETLPVINGKVKLSDKPGIGIRFDHDFISAHLAT